MREIKKVFDVVVMGFGISGLSAAVTAHQNGSKVAILERAPKSERGGNTRYTESLWRMKNHVAWFLMAVSTTLFGEILKQKGIPDVESTIV